MVFQLHMKLWVLSSVNLTAQIGQEKQRNKSYKIVFISSIKMPDRYVISQFILTKYQLYGRLQLIEGNAVQ